MNQGPGALNRIYRLVWNDSMGAFVAVAEHARGRGKRSARVGAVLAAGLLGSGLALADGLAPGALPTGGKVVGGQAAIGQQGSQMTVQQGTNRAAIDWTSFNIGSGAGVRFVQPDRNAVALNRVVGGDVSQIQGQLSANGQVMLVNPNGIVFGKGSRVDVGGIVASTLDTNSADFMAGKARFERGAKAGSIVNQGTITAANGGYAALLAPEVSNQGVISAQMGTVALAGGEAVTLELNGSSLLGVKVDPSSVDTLVENRQMIQADGGQVIMSAGAAQRLLEQAVKGSQGASAMVEQDGKLRLVSAGGSIKAAGGRIAVEGSTVDISGSLQAGGAHAGQVSVQADFLSQSGQLDASASAGRGGTIKVQSDTTLQTASASLKADGRDGGGSIRVDGHVGGNTTAADHGVLYGSARYSAKGTGANAKGGEIAITADSVQLRAATLDASGQAGGGRVRVGGGFHGADGDLKNASEIGINASSVLRADAEAKGDGGQVVVWSDDKTVFGGHVLARSGTQAGNGGQAEVSGQGDLVFQGTADLASRAGGQAGKLLLDPRNLIVDDTSGALASLSMSDPTASNTSGFGTVTKVLANGNVVITAPGADTGSTLDTGAVYLFNSQTGALLSSLRGTNANDKVGSGGIQMLANGNYLVLSPLFGTITGVNSFDLRTSDGATSTYPTLANQSVSAGAITWQSGSSPNAGPNFVGTANSLTGSTANTDSVTAYSYSGTTVVAGAATTVTANDRLGGTTSTIYELADGNVAVAASNWYNGRGAVAWINGSTGALQDGSAGATISAANALVGSTGIRTQAPVSTDSSNRKVYVIGQNSTYFTYTYQGTNVRTTVPGGAGDFVGSSLTVLPNGGYAIASPLWTNGSTTYAGAVTWSGAGGRSGAVSASNSLVGTHAYDYAGSGGVTALAGSSNYVVSSPYWSDSANAANGKYLQNNPNGAVTWVDGSSGRASGMAGTGAAIGGTNSLIGSPGDAIGARSNSVNTLVYASYDSYNGGTSYTTRTGASSSGITPLANGNYLVVDTSWNTSRGSVTFGGRDSGVAGTVSSSNSLVGATVSDGTTIAITELSGSHYVVSMPYWDNGGASDAGSVTRGSGTAGITGTISASNSLVGTDSFEYVGSGGVKAVGALGGDGLRTNYIVLSPQWGGRSGQFYSTVAYGAVSFGSGATGVTGAVSASNSLVGNSAGDYVGGYHYSDSRSSSDGTSFGGDVSGQRNPTAWTANVTSTVDVLDNGNYVVRSPSWSGGKGAATYADGGSGITGTISAANSLVGSIGDTFTTVSSSDGTKSLTYDGYSYFSVNFSRVTTYQTQSGDHVGLLGQALSGGRYLLASPAWSTGRGALTFIGTSGATGTVGAANSVVGSTPDVYADANHSALTSAGDRLGTLADTNWYVNATSTGTSGGNTFVTSESTTRRTGLTWYNHTLNSTSETAIKPSAFTYVAASDWYTTGFTFNGYLLGKELSNGSVLIASPNWNNGSALNAGAITWFGANGQLSDGTSAGTLSATNSLVGSHTNDYLGYRLPIDGVTELKGPNAGNFVIVNPQWWSDRGAVTWGSGTTGVAGTVSTANSLVGNKAETVVPSTFVARNAYANGTWTTGWVTRDATTGQTAGAVSRDGDRVGAGGVTALDDGNAVVASPYWDLNNAAYTNGVYLGYGAPKSKGAASWLNGSTGLLYGGAAGGTVSATNSLVGSTYGDAVSWSAWEQNSTTLTTTFLMQGTGVTKLADGRYAVASPYWNNGAATAAGAVTFGDAGGIAGTVSAANSLVGSTTNDHVGLSTAIRVGTTGSNRQLMPGVTAVKVWNPTTSAYETNYFVRSPDWTNVIDVAGGGAKAGAITWVSGSTGRASGEASRGATVSVANSLVGNVANDGVGSYLTPMTGKVGGLTVTSGDVLALSNIADCDVAGVGAVTLLSGLGGTTGPISWRNSLIGLAPVSGGMNTLSYSTGVNTQNYTSDIQYALLPGAVTSNETVAYRPLVWAAPNASSGKNATQAAALTVVRDDVATLQNADKLNGDANGDLNWTSALYAGNAAGFSGVGGNNGLLGFAASAGQDVVLTPGQLTAMLNAGTDVTLQASRDITVVRDLIVSAGGLGGDLTLDAGRSIRLYGSIETDNGNFTATANQTLANGVVQADCATCSASITMAKGTHIDTGVGRLALAILDSDKTPNIAGPITASTLLGRDISVVNQGADGTRRGMGVRFNAGARVGDIDTEAVTLRAGGSSGAGKGGIVLASDTVITGSPDALFSIGAATASTAASFGGATAGGLALTMTAAEIGAMLKQSTGFAQIVFGRSDQAGATTVGALDFTTTALQRGAAPLNADLAIRGGAGGMTLGGALKSGVATGQALELAVTDGTMTLGATSAVTATTGRLAIAANGSGAVTQASGATLAATDLLLDGSGSVTLAAGTNTVGTVAGHAGSANLKTSGNLTVGSVSGINGLSTDSGMTLQASGATADVVLNQAVHNTNGDLVMAAGRNFVNNRASNTGIDAGTGRYLVYSSNPTDTTEGMGGYSKHYNQAYAAGSTPAYATSGNWFLYSVAPTLTASVGSGATITYGDPGALPGVSIAGFIDGDTLASATSGSLATSTSSYTASGAGFIPVGTYNVSLSGQGTLASALGYNIAVNTGSSNFTVQAKAVNVSGLSANSKVYDGTTTTTVSGTASLQAGGATASDGRAMNGDAIAIGGTASGSFGDRNVGTGKSVALVGLALTGADAGNYVVSTNSVTADITPKTISAAGLSAASSKTYDRTTTATVQGSASLLPAETAGSGTATDGRGYTIDGLSLTGTATGSYNSRNVADANLISFGGLTLAGPGAGNYVLDLGTQSASIAAKALTINGVTAGNKVYDGTATATLTGTAGIVGGGAGGFVAGDSVALSGTLVGHFADANAGNGKAITTSGLALTGADAGNYAIATFAPTADIAKRTIDLNANNQTKTYGDADPTLTWTVGGQGLASGDSLGAVVGGALASATGAAATAGTHAITQGTLAIGNGNYQLGQYNAGTLTVAKAQLAVTADDKAKTYGDADPSLSYTVNASQLKCGDAAGVVSGITLATATGAAATAGTHAITTSGGTAANYDLQFTNGTLTVAKAQLAVSADNKAKTYGDADPTLSYTVNTAQLKYGDTAGVINGLALATATGAAATAGTHAITASGATAANYDVVTSNGTLTVAKAQLAVQADDKSKTYGDADPALSYTVNATQLKYGDTAAVVNGLQLATATGAQATAGTHAITASGGSAANYVVSAANGTLTVAKAQLAVSADDKAKTYGDADPALSYTVNAAQLRYGDAAGVVSGVQLATATGAQATAGTHAITASGGSAANYVVATTNGTLTVAKAQLAVQADDKSKTYGDADPALSYTVNTAQLKYGDTAGVINGLALATATGAAATAGTHAITASGGSAANYDVVMSNGTLTVAKAQLAAQADDKSKTYGDADPALSYTVNAAQLKYGDTAGVINGLQLATATGALATAGTHTIAASGGTAANYDVVASNGTLTVAKAQLAVRADDKSKTYGDADPALSYTVNAAQLKYGDTAGVVSGVQLASVSGAQATAGTHAIDASGGSASNYEVTTTGGTLTVGKAQLTVRADDRSKVYGDADPSLGYTVNAAQLKYGDGASVVSGVALQTAAGAAASAGDHVIAASGGSAANYAVNLQDGTLHVAKAQLDVRADDARKTYGDADPTLGYTVNAAQLKYGDTAGVVHGLALATASGAAATAGTHTITASGADADNYVVTLAAGTLTVDKAALTVTADDQRKTYGAADPTLGYTVNAAQLKYGDAANVVSGVVLSTATGAAATAGTHAIDASGGTAANYAVTTVDGTLAVDRAPLKVTADNKSKMVGEADPALSYRVDASQLKYGDTAGVVSGVNLSAPAGSSPGDYLITASGGSADNYALELGNGILTVQPSPSIRAENLVTQVATDTATSTAAPAAGAAASRQPQVIFTPPAVPQAGMPGTVVVIGGGLAGPSNAGGNAGASSIGLPGAGNGNGTGTPAGSAAGATSGNASGTAAGAGNGGSDNNGAGTGSGSNGSAATGTSDPAAQPGTARSAETAGEATKPGRLLSVLPESRVETTAGRVVSFDAAKAFQYPADTKVAFSATQADGSALPSWLQIDAATGVLQGTPPAGAPAVSVIVTARATDGQTATTKLALAAAR